MKDKIVRYFIDLLKTLNSINEEVIQLRIELYQRREKDKELMRLLKKYYNRHEPQGNY
jgi:hypothetical protein